MGETEEIEWLILKHIGLISRRTGLRTIEHEWVELRHCIILFLGDGMHLDDL